MAASKGSTSSDSDSTSKHLLHASRLVSSTVQGRALLGALSSHPAHERLNIRLFSVIAARSSVGDNDMGVSHEVGFSAEQQRRFGRLQLLINGANILSPPLPLLHLTPRLLKLDPLQGQAFEALRDEALMKDLMGAGSCPKKENKQKKKKKRTKEKKRGEEEEPEVEKQPVPPQLPTPATSEMSPPPLAQMVSKMKYEDDMRELRLHFEEQLQLMHLRLFVQQTRYDAMQEKLDRLEGETQRR